MEYTYDEYAKMILEILENGSATEGDSDWVWLDQRSTKKTFKYSEMKKIEELYRKLLGILPKDD